jgi:hypothetical protein
MATKKPATTKKASAAYKLPIDQVLAAVDQRNGEYYNKLSDEDRKALSTYMIQRWASQVQGSRDVQEHYLITVNDLSNIDYNATRSTHEEMRWRVLALVGLGQKLRHEFIPPKGAKKDKLSLWLIEQFPHLGDEEIELFRNLNDPSVLEDMAIAKNTGEKQIKDLFK